MKSKEYLLQKNKYIQKFVQESYNNSNEIDTDLKNEYFERLYELYTIGNSLCDTIETKVDKVRESGDRTVAECFVNIEYGDYDTAKLLLDFVAGAIDRIRDNAIKGHYIKGDLHHLNKYKDIKQLL